MPALLSTLFDPTISNDDINDACNETIKVTEQQAKNLFESTKSQAASTLWMDHRKGRITASKVHLILKCRASKYPTSIVKGIMQYYAPNDFVPSLQWGCQHEDDARQQYITVLQQQHRNLQTSSSGLIIDPAIPFMGASPDGFSTCDCCGERTIEIKCPFSMRNVSPTVDIALQHIVSKKMIVVKFLSLKDMGITLRFRVSYSLAIRRNAISYVGHHMVSFVRLFMKISSCKMKLLANARNSS